MYCSQKTLTFSHHGVIALCLFAITACGCASNKTKKGGLASWDVRKSLGWKSDKPEPQIPTRLVTTWSDAVLNQVGESSKRGFGGRLVFFNQDSDDPIRVEGQLVVYAFDETNRESHETQPTRKYIFPAEQFVRHESENKLGTSYSVWLPWDEAGGPQRNISLIARFEPKDGPLLVGEQTRHLLPGLATQMIADTRVTASDPLQEPTTSGVQLAGYNPGPAPIETSVLAQKETQPSRPTRPMTTATIGLPSRLAATMQQTQSPSRLSELRTNAAPPHTAESAHRRSEKLSSGPPEAVQLDAGVKDLPQEGLGRSRDSLRETRPAQTTPAAPLIPDRAR